MSDFKSLVKLVRDKYQDVDVIVVIGPPSSGTRLVNKILNSSPDLYAYHDNRHGIEHKEWGTPILVKRDEVARHQSYKARWPEGKKDEHLYPTWGQLVARYPNAPVVHYEDVVQDVDSVIEELADHFGVEPWSFNEEIYDANAEKGSRYEAQGSI